MTGLVFGKRLSMDVRELSSGGNRCPGVWELNNGDYAVVGEDITDRVRSELPEEVMLGPEEKIVLLPCRILQSAKPHIP